ncbi:nucleotidyltransferase domain-containing protein [Candidatus Magnetominusculus xianensis]|uniref:nucleotidyltransferase domain-containing protein n=1 Tax=Candidatus Magnetominusculus xianensis TaxID=1748249 RepID=UPI0019E54019|nr:nucleotidyltransferase domain-containing protein [Candidatus Magnetominusculus xianensis]MBF0404377.1 nucleotidyltransferase domain-containing protein [Nitrospirota bacterium]
MSHDVWIEKFKNEALPLIVNAFSPEMVLIFGSRITGMADEGSDIDIIVVSDYFKGTVFINRMAVLLKTVRFPKHIDALCYSPEEFENIRATSSVVIDALEHGETLSVV